LFVSISLCCIFGVYAVGKLDQLPLTNCWSLHICDPNELDTVRQTDMGFTWEEKRWDAKTSNFADVGIHNL
jgi:hypothetical protein